MGASLGKALQPGLFLTLEGDLGAGKTTLSRGVLRGLGFVGRVKSPTYTLVEPYVISNLYLYHFDLYRFSDPLEWEEAGFREYFNAESICLVEWPEKAHGCLPPADLSIHLAPVADGRELLLTALSAAGKACLNRFNDLLSVTG